MTARRAQLATREILDEIRELVRERDRLRRRPGRTPRLRAVEDRLARRRWDLAHAAGAERALGAPA